MNKYSLSREARCGGPMASRKWAIKSVLSLALLTVASSAVAYRLADDALWVGTTHNATTGGGTATANILAANSAGSTAGLRVNATITTVDGARGYGMGNSAATPVLSRTFTAASASGVDASPVLAAWYTPQINPDTTYVFETLASARTSYRTGLVRADCLSANTVGAVARCPVGRLTIAFEHPVTNPVVHLSRLGGDKDWTQNGNVTRAAVLWTELTLAGGGTLSLEDGNGSLQVAGNTIRHSEATSAATTRPRISPACNPAASTGKIPAACGSVKVMGTFTQLDFDAVMASKTVFASPNGNDINLDVEYGDGFNVAVTVDEDFSDAATSYGTASHVVSDLRLGDTVTVDNINSLNASGTTATPYPGAAQPNPTANGDADDGVTMPATIGTRASTNTSIPVSLSGVSKAATLCGWVDFNRNGGFEASEGVCTPLASGASGATLSFVTPTGASAGNTVARFRVSYDTNQTLTTSTPSSAVDSGEVEDYIVQLVDTPRITVNKTTTGNGPGGTFTFTATNATANPGNLIVPAGNQTVSGTPVQVVSSGVQIVVTETAPPAGYTLASATCTNNGVSVVGVVVNTTAGTITIPNNLVNNNADFVCTFTNNYTQRGQLWISKTNTPGVNNNVDQPSDTVTRGATNIYTITVGNSGPDSIANAVLRDPASGITGQTCTAVTCNNADATGGATCPAAAAVTMANLQGSTGIVLPAIPSGGSLAFKLSCSVP